MKFVESSRFGTEYAFQAKYAKNSNSYIFRSVYHIDMKFDRQLWSATENSWVVSNGGKTIPRWRTVAILKIVISSYFSEKSKSAVLYKFHQNRMNWMNVTWSKMKTLHWTDSEFNRTYFLFGTAFLLNIYMEKRCVETNCAGSGTNRWEHVLMILILIHIFILKNCQKSL